MDFLTLPDIIEHEAYVSWPLPSQVEQDLLLCRAMHAIFSDEFLASQVAMRGGTLLHKVHLAPPVRYSEDIDLVVVGDRPEGHIKRALRRVLEDVLGQPKFSRWDALMLAIRNANRPSRILRMIYSVPSISSSGDRLEIQIETNVTERTPYREIQRLPFEFVFRKKTVKTSVNGFDIHEMLGTKMRALFQRERGRDLFDLYWALTQARPPVDPRIIINAFRHYLELEEATAGRGEFVEALKSRLAKRGFRKDMEQLLRSNLAYEPEEAGALVQDRLLNLLPE
jgi:predicted nucleotidyltransferase component of viral defense system